MHAKEVLENGKVCHGHTYHLYEAVVGKLGNNEVSTLELVFIQALALIHLILDIMHHPVHGEWHAII